MLGRKEFGNDPNTTLDDESLTVRMRVYISKATNLAVKDIVCLSFPLELYKHLWIDCGEEKSKEGEETYIPEQTSNDPCIITSSSSLLFLLLPKKNRMGSQTPM